MMTGGSGPLEGIAVEYLKLIEKRSGIKFSYEKSSTSFAEFLANMKRRQGPDMTSLIVSSPDREDYFSFTESYLSSPYVIFARVKDDLFLDINGLAGKVANGMKLSKEDFPSSPARSREGFFKIVDRSGRLIAVLGDFGYPDSYNYCCVFAA